MDIVEFMKKHDNAQEYANLIDDVNTAKEHLMDIAQKLEEAGFQRKAKSLMTIVYNIEKWQYTKP